MEPLPITTQPGEAAAPPRSDATAPTPASHPQRLQPRESPSAGNLQPRAGVLQAHASRAFEFALDGQHLPSRVGSAEQSNTSIVYGRHIILKLFRRLQSGENPDVEIGRFLTETAHFQNIPPFLGEITITPSAGEKTTVAMLQGLVENEGDGWQWFLDKLCAFYSSVISLPAPVSTPALFTAASERLAALGDSAGLTLEAAALLGRRTAEMHLALATPTDDPAFAPEAFTPEDLNRDALRIEDQIRSAFDALKGKLASLPDDIADDAALLLSRRRELLARARSLAASHAAGKKFRIHGDYHLGQTLRIASDATPTGGDFVMLDFEGEPARTLAERRRKQSPLKDVAGMVRSFSYAAFSALDRFRSAHPDREGAAANLLHWSRAWESAAVAAFLQAYRTAMAAQPELIPPLERAQDLLRAYLFEKGMYEVLYELDNRPTWLRIPLTGILQL